MSPYDLAYTALIGLATPVLMVRPALRKKLARARRERNGDVPARRGNGRCVLIHAVSVGEVNATRELVRQLLEERQSDEAAGRTDPQDRMHVVVSVTTDTGYERARQLFSSQAGRVSVVRYPLDLSSYVRRFLDRLRPEAVVLMELEVWPNFVRECNRRDIPVALVNGRMTERSYQGYRRVRPLVRRMYSGLAAVCAQEQAYADRFVDLGVPRHRVSVTGTMKFDSAEVGERVDGDSELAHDVGLSPRVLGGDEPVVVCGSTGPGEERLLLEVHLRLRKAHPRVRFAIIPRKPERFDEVASMMERAGSVRRRSGSLAGRKSNQAGGDKGDQLILGDTMGELRKFYSLADVVVVGRTLLDLGEKQHGSDMIEPAALGKPIVVGPFTGNFAEPMRALTSAGAIRQVGQALDQRFDGAIISQLVAVLDQWLRNPAAAAAVGRRARQVVVQEQGATARHAHVIGELLRGVRSRRASAGADTA